MSRPVIVLRPLAGALLLASQLAVAAAWLPFEGRVAEGARPGTHIERLGGSDCPPPHDEARCQLCQTMTVRVVTATAVPLSPRATTPIVTPAVAAFSSRAPDLTTRRSRAPPLSLV